MSHSERPLSAPALGSAYANATAMGWESTDHPDIFVKRLFEDQARGERTWLVRMDAGAAAAPHAHQEFEQVYLLEGSLRDGERLLRAGEYVCRAPGAVHAGSTDEGALMLVLYTRA